MTDVYKSRTRELAVKAITEGKNVVIETVFKDPSFKDLVDIAARSSFKTSLVVLFLDTIQQSSNRVAFRSMQQNGLAISGDNVRINFNESFKNVANYFLYFDRTDFIYTGESNVN
jgi:predicted ABC-type ATPase